MRAKLEDQVTKEKTIEIVVRPALYASKCDGCQKVFHMKQWAGTDQLLGEIHGTFDGVAIDANGKGMGNVFLASVCSFQCAHEVFANGGWRKMDGYKPFADQDIPLVRAELRITSLVQDEAHLRAEWAAMPDKTDDNTYITHRAVVFR